MELQSKLCLSSTVCSKIKKVAAGILALLSLSIRDGGGSSANRDDRSELDGCENQLKLSKESLGESPGKFAWDNDGKPQLN